MPSGLTLPPKLSPMSKNRKGFIAFLIACFVSQPLWAGKEFSASSGELVVSDQLIVRLKSGANMNQILASIAPQAVPILVSSRWNSYLLQLPPGIQAIVSKAMAASPQVEYVEPNRLRKVNLGVPNDASYSSQWA